MWSSEKQNLKTNPSNILYLNIQLEEVWGLRGIIIWILAFFSFLSGANVINATIMWFNIGPESTFTPFLLGGLIGAIPVWVYLLVSVLVTLAFLGATSHQVVSELSNEEVLNEIFESVNRIEISQQSQQKTLEHVQARMVLVDESIQHAREEFSNGLSAQGDAIKQRLETIHLANEKRVGALREQISFLDESLTGTKNAISEQAEAIKEMESNLLEKFGPQLAETKDTIIKQYEEIGKTLSQYEKSQKRTAKTLAKQRIEIVEMNSKLASFRRKISPAKTIAQ